MPQPAPIVAHVRLTHQLHRPTLVGGGTALALGVAATIGLVTNSANAAEPNSRDAGGSIPNVQGSVQGWHLKDGTIYGADINPAVVKWFTGTYDNTVTTNSVKDGALGEADLNPALKAKVNKPGVTALESDSPYPGATQLADTPGQGANSTVKFVGDEGKTLQRAWVQCAEGKTAIGGGYQRADEGVAAIKNLQIVTSSPTQIKGNTEVYEPIEGDKAGSLVPNAWLVEGFNNGTTDLILRPSVICATIG